MCELFLSEYLVGWSKYYIAYTQFNYLA